MRRTTEGSLIPNVRSAVSAAPVSRPAAARRSGRATRAGEGSSAHFGSTTSRTCSAASSSRTSFRPYDTDGYAGAAHVFRRLSSRSGRTDYSPSPTAIPALPSPDMRLG